MQKRKILVISTLFFTVITFITVFFFKKDKSSLIQYYGIIPKYNANNGDLIFDSYVIDGNIIKYIEDKTTVKEFKNYINLDDSSIRVFDITDKEKKEDDLIATDEKVQIIKKDETLEYKTAVSGDVNSDGKADIRDILKINKHRLKKIQLSNEYFLAGDVNDDNKADISDMLKINKYRLNKIDTLVPTINYEIKPTEIILDKENIHLQVSNTAKVNVTVLPENVTDKSVRYTSSDENVATVNENGIITGKKEGKCIITIEASNGINSICEVEVLKQQNIVLAEKIELNSNYIDMNIGEKSAFEAIIKPDDTSNKEVTWTSSDSSIVTVDKNGWITAVNEGEAIITSKTVDGSNLTATARVKVTIPIKQINLNTENLNLRIGDSQKIIATLLPENASNKNVKWTSSNENIATVNENGIITAIDTGTCKIIVESENGIKNECNVEVTQSLSTDILAQGINLNLSSLDLIKKESNTIEAIIIPENTTNKNVKWTSEDSSIATVDEVGNVTAVSNGTTRITATTIDGTNLSASATIKVTVPVEEITLNTYNIKIDEEESKTITASVLPEDATNKTITWTSSDENIATVDNGIIIAKNEGTCKITVKSENEIKAECSVTVQKIISDILAEKVELDTNAVDLKVGEEQTIVPTITPENSTDKTITWTSSKSNIAIVDKNGKITAKSNGTTEITATTINGKNATCTVNVTTLPTGVTLDRTNLTIDLSEEKTKTIKALVLPETATNKDVIWTSSNENIAIVDENGQVTGVSNGIATITATTINGKTTTCNVKVETSPVAIMLNETSSILDLSGTKTLQLTPTYVPSFANVNKTITWTSSNTNVVTVTNSGLVTGVSNGIATITAKTVNGKTTTCSIEVKTSSTNVILNQTNLTIDLSEKTTDQLTAKIEPVTSNSDNDVTWTSGNTKIATVSENGVITAISNGTVSITAATASGKTATCTLKVQTSPKGISLNKTSATLKFGGTRTLQLKAKITPTTANVNNKVTYTSSDSNIAKVSSSGLITAVKSGTATITAKTTNGKTATCNITVSVTKISKTLSKSNCTFFSNVENVGECSAVQSICSTYRYYVVAKIKTDNSKGVLCVYGKGTKNRVNTLSGNFYHANGSTYNSDNKCIYISHNQDGKISKIEASSITDSKLTRKVLTMTSNVSGIAYDNYTKSWVHKSGKNVGIYNKDRSEKLNKFEVVCHTGQDCGVYKGLMLSIDYIKEDTYSNLAYVYIYNILTSECYGKYKVTLPGELESIDYDYQNNRYVMAFNTSDGKDAIYTTTAINLDKYVTP